MNKINEYLSYYEQETAPVLSADAFVIYGDKNIYVYDVGASYTVFNELNKLDINSIFISHFHIDHLGNLDRLNNKNVYASKYTINKIGYGNIISSLEIIDGIRLEALEIPSVHSKGAIILTINNEVTLLGDSIYPNRDSYNVSLLHDLIEVLKGLNTKYFVLSHDVRLVPKKVIIYYLEAIYKKRKKNEPLIAINENKVLMHPHHLLCIEFFIGKGYSDEFVEKMRNHIEYLNTNNPIIEFSDDEDPICFSCPNYINNECKDIVKVNLYDFNVFKALELENRYYKYSELKKLINDKIVLSKPISTICEGCQWAYICENLQKEKQRS